MTHILVVGGTGAMGSHVVRRLLATTDATISVPTRRPESARAAELAATAPTACDWSAPTRRPRRSWRS